MEIISVVFQDSINCVLSDSAPYSKLTYHFSDKCTRNNCSCGSQVSFFQHKLVLSLKTILESTFHLKVPIQMATNDYLLNVLALHPMQPFQSDTFLFAKISMQLNSPKFYMVHRRFRNKNEYKHKSSHVSLNAMTVSSFGDGLKIHIPKYLPKKSGLYGSLAAK